MKLGSSRSRLKPKEDSSRDQPDVTEILEMPSANDAVPGDDGAHDGAQPVARRPLGEMLVDAGLIDQRQLADALDEGARTGLRLGEVVVGRGWASEEDVGRLLAEQWGLSYVDRASIWFDADALGRMSREDAQRLEALPTRIEEGRVVVAVAEPTENQIGELRRVIGEDPVLIVVPRTALEAGLHSDLLSSRGGFTAPRPAPVEPELVELDGGDEPDDTAFADVAPVLTALPSPLPEELVQDIVSGADGADVGGFESVAALAAQARGVADLLAAQAATMRDEAATYRGRIDQLEAQLAAKDVELAAKEAELATRDEMLEAVKQHLEAAVRALGPPR